MALHNETHEHRIGTLETETEQQDARLDDHGKRLRNIEQWRDGNGAKGAEQRIQIVEDTMITEARATALISHASKDTANQVVEQMRSKGNHRYRDIVLGIAALSGVMGLVLSAL